LVLGIDLEEGLKRPAPSNFVEFGICRKEVEENDDILRLITNRQSFPIYHQVLGLYMAVT
jgi:hypothetical protein